MLFFIWPIVQEKEITVINYSLSNLNNYFLILISNIIVFFFKHVKSNPMYHFI